MRLILYDGFVWQRGAWEDGLIGFYCLGGIDCFTSLDAGVSWSMVH